MFVTNPMYLINFQHKIVELVRGGRKPRELAMEFDCSVFSILNCVRHLGTISSRNASANLTTPPLAGGQRIVPQS